MNAFWQHPTGKIMSHVVHDFNGAMCSVGSSISLIRKCLEWGDIDREEILMRLVRIEDALKRAEKAVDYGYEKIEEYVKAGN
jgi:hypothetical protein